MDKSNGRHRRMRSNKGQTGLRITNIITGGNKQGYIGRVVRVVPLPWMPRDLFDEDEFEYVRDTLHNIEPEYLNGGLWGNSYVKAGTIMEMTAEEEEEHYKNMNTPRNFGILKVVYRDDFHDLIKLLYRIPLHLDQLKSDLYIYKSMPKNDRLNYLIELITPEKTLLSRRNVLERTAQRKQHRLDRR